MLKTCAKREGVIVYFKAGKLFITSYFKAGSQVDVRTMSIVCGKMVVMCSNMVLGVPVV